MRATVILGVVSLLLLGFIVFFERGSLSTSEREGRKGRILEAFVRDRVDRIEIQRKGVTTVIERQEANPEATDLFENTGGYRVAAPYKAPADRDTVDSLLAALEWIAPRRSLGEASTEDLAKFGLDKPRYRVSFVVGRTRLGFSIGAPSSDGTGAYLLTTDDKRAYVIGKDLVEALDREPTDYHTKALHDGVASFTTEKLSLRDASGESVIQKKNDLLWLQRPEPVLASEPALVEVVNALDALKATRLAAEKAGNLADYGLATPSLTLMVDSKTFDPGQKDKSRIEHLELRVGKACASHAGESYVRANQGSIMCAADADLAKLRKTPAELRESRLLVLDDAEIRTIEIRSGKRELRVEEGKDSARRYRVLADGREVQSGDVDETALSDWLKLLRGAVAEAYEDDPSVSTGAPVTTLRFERGKDKPAYEVQLGRVQGERVAVARGGEKVVAWYGKNVLDLATISGVRFRKPRLLEEDAGALTKLTIRGVDRTTEVVVKRGERFVLEEPTAVHGSEAERSAVDEIARLSAKLEAVRFVADGPAPEHGLGQPSYVLQTVFKSGKTHTLKLGAAADEGRYAQLDAEPAVFIAANALVRQLETPLVSRSALAVPLEQLGRFTITSGGTTLRVEPEAGAFVAVTGAGRDPKLGEALARSIATLRAVRVTAYGKAAADEGMNEPALRVAIQLAGDAKGERTFTIGAAAGSEPDAGYHARRSDLDVGFVVPKSALEALRPPKP